MIGFTVRHWTAWAPGLVDRAAWETWLAKPYPLPSEGAPALSEMPATMRRRVDRLGRVALQASYQAHAEVPDAPVLFASRHGDVNRSVELFTQLARPEPLSPTSFSLSVHNAIGALYSIARGDTSAYGALSAGEETVEAAFIEAHGLLADGAPHVLVVSYEDSLPAVWAPFSSEPVTFPRAWACLVGASTGEGAIQLGCHMSPQDTPPVEADGLPTDLRALRFLVSGMRSWEHPVGARRWRWERHG